MENLNSKELDSNLDQTHIAPTEGTVKNSHQVPQHDLIFDEICNRLHELSQNTEPQVPAVDDTSMISQQKVDKIQGQIKRFQNDLMDSQGELIEKIKTLENVQYSNNDLTAQMRLLTDHLNSERSTNIRLNADLAKSLELCLQLQLEIQGLKSRSLQAQSEDKKFSQSLLEKIKELTHEVELTKALKDDLSQELLKARKNYETDVINWKNLRQQFEEQILNLEADKHDLLQTNEELLANLTEKEGQVEHLSKEIEKLAQAFNDVESSAQQQSQVMKNLTEVAENKIIEMKLALDKKNIETQDYYSHLQQALTQNGVLKQENSSLKDYIAKLNLFIQQTQQQQQNFMSQQNFQLPNQ